jgi:hypothetical protein
MSKFQQLGMIGGQAIDTNSTTQDHQLGLCCKAVDTASTDYGVGEFIYAKGLAATVVGSVVMYSEDGYATKLAVANDAGSIGVAMAATVAGEYGWYQIKGKAVALVKASFADNAAVYLTSTAGSVDDSVVAGDRVHGMIGASAIATPAAGQAEMEINYPRTDNIAD